MARRCARLVSRPVVRRGHLRAVCVTSAASTSPSSALGWLPGATRHRTARPPPRPISRSAKLLTSLSRPVLSRPIPARLMEAPGWPAALSARFTAVRWSLQSAVTVRQALLCMAGHVVRWPAAPVGPPGTPPGLIDRAECAGSCPLSRPATPCRHHRGRTGGTPSSQHP